MFINKPAKAGTMESNDIYVSIFPNEGQGIDLTLESSVIKQFGDQIESAIRDTLEKLNVKDAKITAMDRGALDCTIRARVETAVKRAGGEQ
jgi:citrate lyase subunit gamma (acyl carrier protein)